MCYLQFIQVFMEGEKERDLRFQNNFFIISESGVVEEFLLGDDESEDKVSAEQLKALGILLTEFFFLKYQIRISFVFTHVR